MQEQENFKVVDTKGFHYEVTLKHSPQWGFSTAYYAGRVIAQVDLGGAPRKPMSDDDGEWERYEERFSEWTDEIKYNMTPKCVDYFDNHYNR